MDNCRISLKQEKITFARLLFTNKIQRTVSVKPLPSQRSVLVRSPSLIPIGHFGGYRSYAWQSSWKDNIYGSSDWQVGRSGRPADKKSNKFYQFTKMAYIIFASEQRLWMPFCSSRAAVGSANLVLAIWRSTRSKETCWGQQGTRQSCSGSAWSICRYQ